MSVSAAFVIGIWGVLFPEVRTSQASINQFFGESGNQAVDVVAKTIDGVFSPASAIALTLVLAVIVGISRRSVIPAVGFSVAVLMTWLPVEILKIVFHQGRPEASHVLGSLVAVNPNSSFPSGHVGFAIALSYALLLLFRQGGPRTTVFVALTALVVVVAFTRLYSGVHYLSDTVGSVFAALVGILVFQQLWPIIDKRLITFRQREASSAD